MGKDGSCALLFWSKGSQQGGLVVRTNQDIADDWRVNLNLPSIHYFQVRKNVSFREGKNVFQGRARQFTGLRIQQPDLSEKTAEQQDGGARPRWVGVWSAWRVVPLGSVVSWRGSVSPKPFATWLTRSLGGLNKPWLINRLSNGNDPPRFL